MNRIAAALALLAASAAGPALAEDSTVLADRAEIESLLTEYYNDFGGGVANKVAHFYAPDGEMILGDRHYKGLDAIRGMYTSVPADAPQRKAYALNILAGNMLVKVTGDTAVARLVYTEYVTDKEGDAPRLLTQGREFDQLVKKDGRWWITRREIVAPNKVVDWWKD